MWQIIHPGWHSEDAFVDSQSEEKVQLHQLQQIIRSGWKSEDTHAHPHWRETAHLWTMQQIIQPSCSSEATHAHAHCSKSFSQAEQLSAHVITHSYWRKAFLLYRL